MFVADTRHNRILRYNSSFSTFTTADTSSDRDAQIFGPMAIALTDDGNDIVIASYQNQRVLGWSLTDYTWSFISYDRDLDHNPTGVAIDKNKNIYVVRSGTESVVRYALNNGTYSSNEEWSLYNITGGKHAAIVNDSIYIAQSRLCRVIKVSLLDSYNKILVVAGNGRLGSTSDRLRFPWGVAVDPIDGHIFVSDTGNHRVQLCKSDTRVLLFLALISFRVSQCYRRHHDRRC